MQVLSFRRLSVPVILSLPLLFSAYSARAIAQTPDAQAKEILKETGVSGGFIVHLGCGDGKLTAALKQSDSFQVQGLDRNAANVTAARKYVRSLGTYGPVSIDRLQGKSLPYIENHVNLLVTENLGGISLNEVRRVLVPNGIAYIKQNGKWTKTVKPRPKDIDEWTHYLHDASGNAVANDKQVGPPRHMQWLGSPRWSRHHDRMASMSALVAAGGRIFYIMDEGSRISIQLPSRWKLIARDAFNGTILWKKDIPNWQSRLWPLKSGPTQLARRLVATKDHVFLPLGFESPLSILDAKTGKTLQTLKGTKSTEEVIHTNGKLFMVVNPGKSQLRGFKPKFNVGDQRRVRTEFTWDGKPRRVVAADVATGKVLWSKPTRITPLSLAADAKRIFFFDGTEVVCLNQEKGEPVWKSAKINRRPGIQFNFGPRLVVHKNTVLFAGGDRKMSGIDTATGKVLWSAKHDRSGYESPEDLLVANGLVWTAPTTRTSDTGTLTGLDPRTGKVKVSFKNKVSTYWFHHRCYIAKATNRFIIPSRTGVEFVDVNKKDWEIHHWVRGGCLYGVMPCNGLLYAPPHNCACYPEAKLYGFNVLAPASKTRPLPVNIPEAGRLEQGPAYGKPIAKSKKNDSDWPTYRHDNARSGVTRARVPAKLGSAWSKKLGGRLTAPVAAEGKLFVAKVNEHTVYALNANSGKTEWTYTAGGRVDSPPTIVDGRVVFGSADGWAYCLRASDGALIWRYRAAPLDRRLMAFEQLESVWPVHGSILVQDGIAFVVAGRSNFLDGGLRMIQLHLNTGKKRAEAILNDRNPITGKPIQEGLQILQMAAGLPDILSSDGKSIYMRSQRFNLAGKRNKVGPVSGSAPKQGAAQSGEGRHLFAPMGFLDDTWFHRSYWVYGKNFAGGHNGYYQAGKYTPSGRLIVKGEGYVYGFARKPQYYKWTTTIEHQLFSAPSSAPVVVPPKLKRRGRRTSMVRFTKSKSLDPTGKSIIVEAWVKAERPNGTIVAHGGPADGYALILRDGSPRFVVRRNSDIFPATSRTKVVGKWTHVVGMLTADKQVRIYVNGKLEKTSKAAGLLEKNPVQSLQIGADDGSAVGQYRSPYALRGVIDQVKVLHGSMTDTDVAARFKNPAAKLPKTATPIVSVTFDKGKAQDASGKKNHGKVEIARSVKGKIGNGLRFLGGGRRRRGPGGGSFVKNVWNKDLPMLVRAMFLADNILFIAGPPDLMDEEKTFKQLMAGDKSVNKLLQKQDDALNGAQGGLLWAVSTDDGKKLGEVKLPSLPVWDGMITAGGRVFLSTIDGQVISLKGK